MKRLTLLLIFTLITTVSFAETITLENGEVVEGTITERTDDFIKVDTGIGVDATYYLDEVEKIENRSSENIEKKENVDNVLDENVESINVKSEELDSLIDKSEELIDGGDYDKALNLLQRAQNIDPNNSLVYGNKGMAQFFLGSSEGALLALHKAEALGNLSEERWVGLYNALGHIYLSIKQSEKAIKYCEKSLQIESLNNRMAFTTMSTIYFQKRDWNKVVFYNEKMLAIVPEDAMNLLSLGIAYGELGNEEKAKYFSEKGQLKMRDLGLDDFPQ